ncbi:TPA: hypothetical protein ACKRQV_001247 [Pseudomonas aeruginosa]|nr:hypothetical protein [Pseudomonas aeruginosa]EIU2864411.1 hypothetical protein [Pseudomonas aeruginosa]
MAEYLDDNGNFDVKRWAVWAEGKGYLPWQMTLKEYSVHLDQYSPKSAGLAIGTTAGSLILEVERLAIKHTNMAAHRRAVESAIAAGKNVRPEVLAEYGL